MGDIIKILNGFRCETMEDCLHPFNNKAMIQRARLVYPTGFVYGKPGHILYLFDQELGYYAPVEFVFVRPIYTYTIKDENLVFAIDLQDTSTIKTIDFLINRHLTQQEFQSKTP